MAKKPSKSKKVIPKNESKSERFVRVVTPRVNKAVKAISVIGYCAGSTYEYTSKQIDQIMKTLAAAESELLARFAGEKEAQEEFTFNE